MCNIGVLCFFLSDVVTAAAAQNKFYDEKVA